MKKLLLLFLAMAGMVSTVSAKTIYLVENWPLTVSSLYLYTGSDNNTWPGASLTAVGTVGKSDGFFKYYKLELGSYETFVIVHSENDGRTQTADLKSNDYTDGAFYEFSYTTKEEIAAATLYTYNFTVNTAENYENLYIHLWRGESTNLDSWPGAKIEGNSFTFRSYVDDSSIGVLFNQGSGQPQTCDMTAAKGDNTFYISSMASSQNNFSWGEAVKTNAYGYATYVCSNNLTIPSDIAYCAEDLVNGSAFAHNVTNPAASTAMLIKGNGNTTYHFATAATGSSPLGYTNAFIAGTSTTAESGLANTTDGKYNYILNNNVFYLANGKKVATNKAYLQLSAPAAARVLVFEDESTGITAITNNNNGSEAYYNLSGQRVAAPKKGLYIQNGKKMIVK